MPTPPDLPCRAGVAGLVCGAALALGVPGPAPAQGAGASPADPALSGPALSDPPRPARPVPPVPSQNLYGAPGLIDLPSGEAMPDGEVALGLSYFGGIARTTLSFQMAPWLSGSFRYSSFADWNSDGFDTYYDRSFDLRFRLLEETDLLPSVTLGLQDLAGTGISSAEYIVATKELFPGVKGSLGLGWGRLGASNNFSGLISDTRPGFDIGDEGGTPNTDQWFRGPQAFFGGLEWQVTDRLGLKAEYSPDPYAEETARGVIDRKTDFNFGLEYQASDSWRLGAYSLYGAEFGVMAQLNFNPRRPASQLRVAAPPALQPRQDPARAPQLWRTGWADDPDSVTILAERLAPAMAEQGLRIDTLSLTATRADLRFRNLRYLSTANAVGRAARVLAQGLPASVELFVLTPVEGGLPTVSVTLRRSDLEQLEYTPDAGDRLRARARISEAAAPDPQGYSYFAPAPGLSWFVGPYLRQNLFDPDDPWRYEIGVQAGGRVDFTRQLGAYGTLTQKITGTIEDSDRVSDSQLPPVRTDQIRYAQTDGVKIEDLALDYRFRPGTALYGRVTGGYLEQMFAGLSGELLWKPVDSALALGLELSYARQRGYDQRFDLLDYDVVTGHASAYYEFGEGYIGRVDAGRYLAGDWGGTFTFARAFDSGWTIGAFFTLTDVSSKEFGEGSFDKGIFFELPVGWFLGQPQRQSFGTTIRPVQRDGGQRLEVRGRLYEQVRRDHARALTRQWERVWQ